MRPTQLEDRPPPILAATHGAMALLAKQSLERDKVVSSLAKRGGTFSNLGGDVDSMIEHGQEAWAAVKRLLNVETKNLQGTMSATVTSVGSAYYVDFLGNMTQGDSDAQRNGDSIKVNRLRANFRVEYNPAIAPSVQYIRVMLVASVDELVEPADVNVRDSTPYAPFGLALWDKRQQYTVLYDRLHDLSSEEPSRVFRIDHDFREHHAQFLSGSTTITKGGLQLLFWSGENVQGTPVVGDWSLDFVDN